MRRVTVAAIMFLSLLPSHRGQPAARKSERGSADLQTLLILSDLKALGAESLKLEKPLARALVGAEIAGAAWGLEREWAKTLLLESYKLTLQKEDQQKELDGRPSGKVRSPVSNDAYATYEVRARIFSVAGRDKDFAAQLAREGGKQAGAAEESRAYERLAGMALGSGNAEEAARYAVETFEADPTRGAAADVINGVALQDRAAADKLVLSYIETLRTVPLSQRRNLLGVQFSLYRVVFPNSVFPEPGRQIPPPGRDVMRAYVAYVIEALGRLEQSEPGSLRLGRNFLLSAWLPLRQHAPELTPAFNELELLSRRPGQDASLPTQTYEERDRELHDRRLREALDADRPGERAINSLIARGDFDNARKAIDRLSDGAQKAQLTDALNMRESLSLAAKGDVAGATRLAEKLTSANSIIRVYPAIVRKCSADGDRGCASGLVHQAVKQLRAAASAPKALPGGVASPIRISAREFDPLLLGLSRLAKAVAPADEGLALEVLDELVSAANRSQIDTGQGRAGFETDIFKLIAQKNEPRALQSANALKDRLHRVAALAAVYQWKAQELAKRSAPAGGAAKQ
jgi:hypothetical protein